LGERVDAELVGHGELLHPGDHLGNTLRQVGREVAKVTQNRRKAKGEEEGKNSEDRSDQKYDSDTAGGVVAAKTQLGDAADCRHQNHGKEGTDVQDEKLFLESPGEGKKKEYCNAEEDMAANFGAGSLLVWG
jgi:hypothetical protein